MANILDKAKNSLRKISDNVNRDKWDKNCINSALFTDPEPGKHVPPARQEGVPAPVPAGGPAQASRSPGATAIQMGNSNGNTPIVAPAPEILHSGEKPTIKPGLNGEQENKPVRFINPRFNRSINYVTSKVVMPGSNNVRSLEDLPTVDPSQSISSIGGGSQAGEAAAGAAATPDVNAPSAAAVQPAQQPLPAAPQSEPSPAVAAAMAQQAAAKSEPSPAVAAAMAQQAAAQPVQQAAPQITMPQQPAQLPLSSASQQSEPSPAVAAAMAQQAAAQPVQQAAPQITMPQQPAQLPLSSAPQQPAPAAAQPIPVVVAPSVSVAAVQASPMMTAVQTDTAAEQKAVVSNDSQAVPAADAVTIEEKCYYVLIKHTKTFPAPGSRVLMRNCDSQYAWTDEKPESERPTYKVCPNCGKPIDIIETEMD